MALKKSPAKKTAQKATKTPLKASGQKIAKTLKSVKAKVVKKATPKKITSKAATPMQSMAKKPTSKKSVKGPVRPDPKLASAPLDNDDEPMVLDVAPSSSTQASILGRFSDDKKGAAKKPAAEVIVDPKKLTDTDEDDDDLLDEPVEPEEINPDDEVPDSAIPVGSSPHLPAKSAPKTVSTTDPITSYLNEVRRYPLLTREQEVELAKLYYDTKDPVAAQALVTANLRFVVKVAAEYSKFGAKLIDLVQEGNMGLMHAVRDFNPYKGNRLITYAVWWIRGYIQEYLLKQYSMVKIATTLNQKKLFYRLQKEKDALDAMGEHPNFKMIGERMGIPEDEVEQMANRLSGRDVSLNTPLDDASSSSLMDLQKSSDMGVDDQIGAFEELELLKEKLLELRDDLNEREKIILEERILADEPLTLQEIGEKYGITREAVRQTEARLMKKIRDKYMAPAGDDGQE